MMFLMQVITAMAIELGKIFVRVAVKAVRSRSRRRPRPWRVALLFIALGLGLSPNTSAGPPARFLEDLEKWVFHFKPYHDLEPIRHSGLRELVGTRAACREFATAIEKHVINTYQARYFRLTEGGAEAVDLGQEALAVIIKECDRALGPEGAARAHPLGRGVFDEWKNIPAGLENTEEYRRLQDAVTKAAVTRAQNQIILREGFRAPGMARAELDSLIRCMPTGEDVLDAREFYELLGEAIRQTSLDEKEGACLVAYMMYDRACSDEELIKYSARLGILDGQLAVLKVRKAQGLEELPRRTRETAQKAMKKLKAELPSTLEEALNDVLEKRDFDVSVDLYTRRYDLRGLR